MGTSGILMCSTEEKGIKKLILMLVCFVVKGQHFLKSLVKRFNAVLKNKKASYAMKDDVMCFNRSNLRRYSELLTLCLYKFSVPAHNVNVE